MKPLLERFLDKVERKGPQECWPWTGSCDPYGRGRFNAGNVTVFAAPRVSWFLFRGEIPDGLQVLHRCDNPNCVNPAHLFLGTQPDNLHDMIAKGRRGNCGRKLKAEDVQEIRRLGATGGNTQAAIARRFGVSQSNVSLILMGKSRGQE